MPVPLLIQLPANALGRQQEGPTAWASTTHLADTKKITFRHIRVEGTANWEPKDKDCVLDKKIKLHSSSQSDYLRRWTGFATWLDSPPTMGLLNHSSTLQLLFLKCKYLTLLCSISVPMASPLPEWSSTPLSQSSGPVGAGVDQLFQLSFSMRPL